MVTDVEGATHSLRASADAERRRAAARIAADMYFLLRTFTKRIGRTDLSLLVADRGLRAAEDADDPLRIAAATWNVGQVLLAANEADVAEEFTIRAAETLAPSLATDLDAMALSGALWLVAVIASPRSGDAWTARDRLREHARPAPQRTGEENVFWTVFRPTNTALHAVSVEMEAGEAGEALRLANQLTQRDARQSSAGRRSPWKWPAAMTCGTRTPAYWVQPLAAEQEHPRTCGTRCWHATSCGASCAAPGLPWHHRSANLPSG